MASILSLASVLGGEIAELISWYQSRGLIARSKSCPTCNHVMDMPSRSDITDKYRSISVHGAEKKISRHAMQMEMPSVHLQALSQPAEWDIL